MTFKSNLAGDIDKIFLNTDEFADTITYTPDGGGSKQIKAIVDGLDIIQSDVATRENETDTIRITINSDPTLGIASPGYGDTAIVKSLTYKLNSVLDRTANTFLLEFVIIKKTQALALNIKAQR